MNRAIRVPRLRLLLLVVVVALAFLVSWHLVAPGIHGMAMMLGVCMAFVAAAAALLTPETAMFVIASVASVPTGDRMGRERIEPIGRHPPDEGMPLRH